MYYVPKTSASLKKWAPITIDLKVILRSQNFIAFNVKELWFSKVLSQMPLAPSFSKLSQQQQQQQQQETYRAPGRCRS